MHCEQLSASHGYAFCHAESNNTAIIAGIAGGVGGALLLAALAIFALAMKRNRRQQDHIDRKETGHHSAAAGGMPRTKPNNGHAANAGQPQDLPEPSQSFQEREPPARNQRAPPLAESAPQWGIPGNPSGHPAFLTNGNRTRTYDANHRGVMLTRSDYVPPSPAVRDSQGPVEMQHGALAPYAQGSFLSDASRGSHHGGVRKSGVNEQYHRHMQSSQEGSRMTAAHNDIGGPSSMRSVDSAQQINVKDASEQDGSSMVSQIEYLGGVPLMLQSGMQSGSSSLVRKPSSRASLKSNTLTAQAPAEAILVSHVSGKSGKGTFKVVREVTTRRRGKGHSSTYTRTGASAGGASTASTVTRQQELLFGQLDFIEDHLGGMLTRMVRCAQLQSFPHTDLAVVCFNSTCLARHTFNIVHRWLGQCVSDVRENHGLRAPHHIQPVCLIASVTIVL